MTKTKGGIHFPVLPKASMARRWCRDRTRRSAKAMPMPHVAPRTKASTKGR